MSLLAWIALGIIAGLIAHKLAHRSFSGANIDIVLGIAGAIIGGWLFTSYGVAAMVLPNIYSLLVAAVGAIGLLMVHYADSHDPH
ncbi:GlsB/YeaQ/YmgE family stress response membrane protein [Chitinolyticbacter albus]|uniref:GlsB/YeaQ/YmgE family stress response membrane protein n=1 Tax=Chitinolyticbacter albus TaxID=2961951 RepID=UPI00210AC874|nr:GlsB/YeaQ/YmgE family stress response membrane protein [Chitinolyticbacter albus]